MNGSVQQSSTSSHPSDPRALSQPQGGAASESGAANGVVELAIPATGLGGSRRNWGQPGFPYCQVSTKICPLGEAAGSSPTHFFGAWWDVSLSPLSVCLLLC